MTQAATPKKGGRVASVIFNVLVGLILVLAVIMLVVSICYRVQGETLTVAGVQCRVVLTGSMEGDREDSIRTHAIVGIEVAPVGEEKEARLQYLSSLKEGDIITFYDMGKQGVVNTHRILEVKGEGASLAFITHGDANPEGVNETVEAEDVIGKVVWSNYALGKCLFFLGSPTGIVVCLIIPAAVILVYEVLHIVHILSAEKRRKQQETADAREQEIERLRRELEAANAPERQQQETDARDQEIERLRRELEQARQASQESNKE